MRYARELPRIADVDVCVAGAGSAGVCAAIAAARGGASVLLVERFPFLGGTSTAVLDTFYGFFTPGEEPLRVVGGLPVEIVDGLRALGPVVERPNTFGAGTGVTYHPEHLKVVWERLAGASGVRILLHATVQDAAVTDGRVRALVVATKAGLVAIEARVFVDATGDADLCHFARLPYEVAGELAPAQTLTTTFKLVNVDVPRRRAVPKAEINRLMAEAAESGAYELPRREGSDHITPVEGMTATIMTRVPSYERTPEGARSAVDPDFLTRAEIEGRRQALEYVRFLVDRVPGYERSALSTFSTAIGVRETRRVYGDYRLTREDVLAARAFDDGIGLCGAPIEDHHEGTDTRWHYLPAGRCVGIPYRSLVVRDTENVLVAGRCFSSTHDAHASVRSMAQTMAMGQAAGTAAAMAAQGGAVRGIDVDRLRGRLRADGALLDEPVAPPELPDAQMAPGRGRPPRTPRGSSPDARRSS